MKLRRVEETEAYWTPEGEAVLARPPLDEHGQPRTDPAGRPLWDGPPTMIERIRGKPLSEAKAIVRPCRKTKAHRWVDIDGNHMGWSYGDYVKEIIIPPPPDAQERMMEALRRLRELNAQIAAVRQRLASPDVTQADRDEFLALQAEALELQTEYLRFREIVDD